MTAAPDRRFPIGLTVFTVIALAVLCGLGTWQVQRLHWKEALLAHIAALRTAPARPLDGPLAALAGGGDADFTRVSADCPDLEQRPYLKLYAVWDGQAGSRIIAACPLKSGPYGSLLVDRGFLPQTAPPLASSAAPLSEPVTGVLRHGDKKTFVTPENQPAQRQFYYRDVAAMAAVLGAPRPAPIFLMLEKPAPKAGLPLPAPIPPDIPNRHLEYAITWFGLAAALLGVYLASLWRRLAK